MDKSYLIPAKNTVLSLKPSKATRLLLMVLFVYLFSNVASAQTTSPYLVQSDDLKWICPVGVSSIDVKAWGAGAGGLLTYGGGGGGAYAGNKAVAVTPGATYIIKVGTGGGVGVAGGNSSLALASTPTVFLVKAEGGKAGSNTGGVITLGTGGSANNCIGSPGLVWSGGSGTMGDLNKTNVGGGGGGSAGAGGDGVAGSAAGAGGAGGAGTVGTAGTSGAAGGDGGTTGAKNGDGSPGSNPGGGGGEKFYNNGNNASSGSGGNGQVIISWCSSTKTEASTTTWSIINGGSWSNGYPTNIKDLVFDNDYSSPTDLEGCSCKVSSGVNVDINSGHTLTLTNGLSVARTGTILFKNESSLVQINNVANIGDITYRRTTGARTTDYTYWSSPVSLQTLGKLYPFGGTFYSYEATSSGEDWKRETAGTTMEGGKGYIANQGAVIPLPGTPTPPGLIEVAFTGIPNNGHYEIDGLFAGKSYLLGNPYPSALDAETFLQDNSGVLNGTLYFWTHNTLIGIGVSNPGTGVYAYSGNDYATYNATGGVAANQRDIDPTTGQPYLGGGGSAPSSNTVPTGKIASGQGFFASSKAAIPANSKIIYDNTMRVGVNGITGNNSQFFKTRNPNGKTANTVEKNRVWLNLTNTEGAFKQTLIGYVTDATNDYDERFDGESFDGNKFVDFYSVNQDKNLVIQGRALPFDDNDEVQLGFRTTINGTFTIKIDQVDGLLTKQAVFIEDKVTNTIFDLKSGNYTFTTIPGTFNDRFVLRYTNETLGTENFDSSTNNVLVSNANKQIKINSFAETIDKVIIYDLLGRQIFQKANVNSKELAISNLVSSHQTLVVKTLLQNGKSITEKIIY